MEVQRYPDGLRRHHRRRPGDRHADAGRPRAGLPEAARVAGELPADRERWSCSRRRRVAACDARDGLKDGLVTDPRRCHFKPETLKCAGADAPNCLTAPQLDVVKQIYERREVAKRRDLRVRFPVGHEGGTTGWQAWIDRAVDADETGGRHARLHARACRAATGSESNNFSFLALEDDDPLQLATFNLDRDLPRMKTMSEILSPLDADLRPYKNAAASCSCITAGPIRRSARYGTVDYYEQVAKVVGGQKEAEAFARLYLVPGMHHCSGGPGPNSSTC